jgi:thiamine biosynthesis lipoprotein
MYNVQRIDFHAMGTDFFCIAVEPTPDMFDSVYELATDLEKKWSRFISDSELMQLNNAPGSAVKVSAATIRLISEMQNAFEITDGLFDPNVLGQVIDAGFAASKDDDAKLTNWSARAESNFGILDVEVDQTNSTVTIPIGVGLDAGGLGKGLAADLMAIRAMELGTMGIAVFAGGDVSVRGISETGEGWQVGIQDPAESGKFADTVSLSIGGIATSGLGGWLSKAGDSHIINPKSGLSVKSVITQTTVVARAAVHAEALTKISFMLPIENALATIENAGAQALIFDSNFNRHETTEWKKYK